MEDADAFDLLHRLDAFADDRLELVDESQPRIGPRARRATAHSAPRSSAVAFGVDLIAKLGGKRPDLLGIGETLSLGASCMGAIGRRRLLGFG